MATEPTADRMAELRNAYAAAMDLEDTGATDRKCVTCGGELVMRVAGSSYQIICKAEDRVIVTSRGI